MKNIGFVDLKQRYIEEKNELNEIINNTLSSGNLVISDDVKSFESDICEHLDKKYCISLNSGTDALMMSLWALGITKGDEVITSTISFIATAGAIAHVGAKPVFVDCGEDLNIDVNKIEDKISKNTKAIMPVHWTGKMADMDKIKKIADRNNLLIIEDAAQAIGSELNNYKPGKYSEFATFSAHPLKPMNAIGDAGYLVTDNDEHAKNINLYRNHGLESRDNAAFYGVNSRMDGVNAAILRMRLKKLKSVIERRRKNVNLYRDLIKTEEFKIIPCKKNEYNSFAMFVCFAKDRDKLKLYLSEKGIESLIYYGNPLHLHQSSINLGYKEGDFPISETLCKSVISIPFHQYLINDEIEYISNAINSFYAR